MLTAIALGTGLAMDAVAVSIAAGICGAPLRRRDAPSMAVTFGLFQWIMPLIGWGLGWLMADWIQAIDHWVAFGLLSLIGGKMVKEALDHDGEDCARANPFTPLALLIAGFATSIDALAVGMTLAALGEGIWTAALIIALITAGLCWPAVLFGARLGRAVAHRAALVGGLLLIGLGVKILAEHLGWLGALA